MKKLKILLPVLAMTAVGFAGFAGSEAKVANAAAGDTYNLVTSVSELAAGDTIAIVATGYNFALSTTQNKNNRGQAAIVKSGSSFVCVDGVQEITLGVDGSNYTFNVGDGYLYAASSSSNYLRTQATNNANGIWSISIASDGTATIKATGSNSRNVMQYNQSSSLFSCYSSASQKAVAIYKQASGPVVPEEGPVEYTATFDASPASFIDATNNTIKVEAEEAGAEATITLPTADKLVNNGSFYAGTANVTGWEDGDGNTYGFGAEVTITGSTIFKTVHQQNQKEISIATALEIAASTGTDTVYEYTTTGFVESVDEAYSSQWNNITVTFGDGEGNSIKAYRLKAADGYDVSELEVGSKITVTGNLKKYNDDLEFTNGTAVVHLDELAAPTNLAYDNDTYTLSWDEVTGAEAYSLVITGSEGEVVNEVLTETSYNVASLLDDTYTYTIIALGDATHNDSVAATDTFTKSAPATETVQFVETKASLGFGYNKTVTGTGETVYTASYSGSTTNMEVDGTDQASLIGLEGSGIKVIANKGTNTTAPGLNADGSIRLYYKGNFLEFSTEENIKSIKVNYLVGKNATVAGDGAMVSLDNTTAIEGTGTDDEKTYAINSNKFYIKNTHTSTSKQVWISSIEITVGSGETTWEFGNVRMRFQATVDADLYTRLNAEAAGFEVTAAGSTKVETIDCTANVGTNEEGNRYIIGSITQIPETAYNTVLTAKAFFTVDGVRVYLQEVSYSVATLVEEYLTTYYASLDAEAQEAIKAFSETL